MKRLLTLMLCALIGAVTTNLGAAPRSRQQARAIAQERAESLGLSLETPRARRAQAQSDDNAPFYIFNQGTNQGWTIVAGDDRLEEIVGYSDSGSLDEDQLPPPVQEMLKNLENHIKNLGEDDGTAARAPRRAAASGTAAMGPYLTTRWDQYAPYNILTPTQSGSHTATCCVVTATAQILYYLYYTIGGQSSSTFSSSIDSYSLSASGSYVAGSAVSGPRTYNWSKMLPDYAEGYTDEQATAVATLMRDLGTAVKVNYNTSVSITNSKYVANNAAALFGLQSGSSYTYNSSMGASTWKNAVITELGNYRPVLVASTAHAYVCDGYDGNGLYHFNFGYSGRGDGWYTFDAMNGYGQATWGYTTGLKLRASDTNVTKLDDICKTARAQAALTPVGTEGGNYRQDLYNALMALVAQGETAVANNCSSMSDTEVTNLCTQISQAIVDLTMKRAPYPTGTYYIKTYTNYSDGNTKAMYASGTGVNWGTISTSSDNYKWYLEYDESTNAYKMYNVGTNGHFTSISTSTQAKLSTSSTTEVEVRTLARVVRNNKNVYACTIRPMVSGYNTGFNYYCHQGSHSNGSGTSGSVVGWEPYSDYNQWYFEPIDVEEVTPSLPSPTSSFANSTLTLSIGSKGTNKLTTNSTGTVTYTSSNTAVATVSSTGQVTAVSAGTATITATIAATSTYAAGTATYTVTVTEDTALRNQLNTLIATAQGLYTSDELSAAQNAGTTTVGTTNLITNYSSQFTSPYTESSEGAVTNLDDSSASTFWHSAWSSGNVTAGTHYFVVALNSAEADGIYVSMTRRSGVENDHPTQFVVYGSNNNSTWTQITTLNFSFSSAGETVNAQFDLGASYTYLKFVCTNTYVLSSTNSGNSRGYFHMGEFKLYRVTTAGATEKQQALLNLYAAITTAQGVTTASQSAIDALQSAIDAYKSVSSTTELAAQTVTFAQSSASVMVGSTVTNAATTNGNGAITYSSSNTSVATVNSNGVVTGVAAGTATITATAAATSTYAAATATYTVTVTEDNTLRNQLDALIATAQGLYTSDELSAAQNAGTTTVGTTNLITNYSSQFTSPYTESSEGAATNLNDGSASTFWHSAWSSGNVTAGTHYFVVALNSAETEGIYVSMTRRSGVSNDHPTQFVVYGSNNNSTWTQITTLNFSYSSAGETVTAQFDLGASYTYLKFVCTNTYVLSSTNSGNSRGYFHMGEFKLYRVTTTAASDKQQALLDLYAAITAAQGVTTVTQSNIDALQSAIDNYNSYAGTTELARQTVSFAQSSATVQVGNTVTNAATTTGNGAITYSSSNTAVATVNSNGVVTGISAGTATITASAAATSTYAAASASYTVTVEKQQEEVEKEVVSTSTFSSYKRTNFTYNLTVAQGGSTSQTVTQSTLRSAMNNISTTNLKNNFTNYSESLSASKVYYYALPSAASTTVTYYQQAASTTDADYSGYYTHYFYDDATLSPSANGAAFKIAYDKTNMKYYVSVDENCPAGTYTVYTAMRYYYSYRSWSSTTYRSYVAYFTFNITVTGNGVKDEIVDDIQQVDADIQTVDVYAVNGHLVRKGVARNEALKNLTRGIYVVDGKRIMVK